jgi:hypothetical protein
MRAARPNMHVCAFCSLGTWDISVGQGWDRMIGAIAGTTSPTEKLNAEDLGYSHELWIRSMWVTEKRVREGDSPEGDDTASMTRRSRNIPGTDAHPNISGAC